MLNKNNFLYILILLIIILVVFWPLQWVFYQQDEWHALGFYLSRNNYIQTFKDYNLIKILAADGRLFANILGSFLIGRFPFNTFPLFVFSLIFHILNAYLVFKLAKKFFDDNISPLIASIFFGVSSVSLGAVTWYGTSIGTLPSTTLIILSVIFFLKALENNARKSILFSFITLYLSQYFKETGYFLLLFLPFLFIFLKGINFKKFIVYFWYYFVAFALIACYRLIQLNSYVNESVVFTASSSGNFLPTLLVRSILYPLTSFFLVYIPPEFFLKAAKNFTTLYYPYFPSEHASLLIQSVVGDLLAVTGSLLLLFSIFFTTSNKNLSKTIFLVVFALVTYLPYIILSKDYTYLDSRYYYLGAVPASIILALILHNIKKRFNAQIYSIFLFVVLVYLIFLATVSRTEIYRLVDTSKERVDILNQFSKLKPKLEEKNIFYITGNKDYYLSEGNNLPFQQGMGYTLLTWYGKDDDRFNSMLEEFDLWDLGSQGYIEGDDVGFGFFWNKEEFLKTVKEKNLSKNEINYFYYDSSTKKLNKQNPETIN